MKKELSKEVLHGGKKQCNQCGNWYKNLSMHWEKNSVCEQPHLPIELLDFAIGAYFVGNTFGLSEQNTGRVRVTTLEKEKAQTVRLFLGLFGNDIHTREKTDRLNEGTNTIYKVNMIKHGELRLRNMKISNINNKRFVLEVIAYLRGRNDSVDWPRGWWNR